MKYFMFSLIFFYGLISCSNLGEAVPAFELETLDGKSISNEDLKGKVTVINVWATWCGNCLSELDELNKLEEKYHNDATVVFLAIADEKPEVIQRFLDRRAFNYIQVSNGKTLTDALQTRLVKTYPQHIILNQDLKISYEQSGELNDALSELSQEIEKLLHP